MRRDVMRFMLAASLGQTCYIDICYVLVMIHFNACQILACLFNSLYVMHPSAGGNLASALPLASSILLQFLISTDVSEFHC